MVALRTPDAVMRLERLGAAHQTRLSFMRVLLRGLRQGGWTFDRPLWDVDANGVGRAVYRMQGQGQCYSLVAFAHDMPDEMRTDRVIAEAWDATFALFDGTPSQTDLDRLAANVPLQEAGRVSDRELVLSRANRSVRLWDYVVGCLAGGDQPDPGRLDAVGYLMRTTAVYGSGKFGAADFAALSGRPLLDGPFRAEMLTVWLIRAFILDLAEHMAREKGGDAAVPLAPELRRRIGVGNSTGLGMAPFLVNHPGLLNAWITARETALTRVCALPHATDDTRAGFAAAVRRSKLLSDSWTTDHPGQAAKLSGLRQDIARLEAHLRSDPMDGPAPWSRLWRWASEALSVEGQELTLSLMLEPHGDLVDDLAETMTVDETAAFPIEGAMSCAALLTDLEAHYGWALGADYDETAACARFWYVSEAKLEPRLGERHDEPGGALEQPLDIARRAAALAGALEEALAEFGGDTTVAAFLRLYPAQRRMVRRVQMCRAAPYSEIRGNLIDADLMPIDMLRCKLAFFGATRFDPRSDRWVRITMYQNAPFPHELQDLPLDDWVLPTVLDAAE